MHETMPGLTAAFVVLGLSVLLAMTVGPAGGQDDAAGGASAVMPAEGFGADSTGGEGGEVIWVTNLDDSGPGSFREAVAAEGPRIVKFKVGGIIDLTEPIRVEHGRLTIDGASAADYGGITLHGGGLYFSGLECRDVIVRHIRVRRAPRSGDCIGICNGAHRSLIDHCSTTWADDENFGINKAHYVTVQWCLIGEGIIEGDHPKGAHSMGMLVAHGANHVSVHHNFWTGNVNRNPLMYGVGGYGSGGAFEGCYAGEKMAIFQPTCVFDVRNNLVFNFRGGTQLASGININIVNNYYRYGPSSGGGAEVNVTTDTYYPGSERPKLYCTGNIGPHRPEGEGDDWAIVRIGGEYSSDAEYRSDREFLVPPVTTHPAGDIVEMILAEAGAHPHDDVDLRLIEEYRTGEGKAGYGYLEWKEKHGL